MSIDWDTLVIGPLHGIFAESVTYMPFSGAPGLPITGVFDDAYLKEVMFEDASSGVTEVSAVLGVQVSQFQTSPVQNDQLQVKSTGAVYLVREVRPDSHGAAKLLLSKASYP
jgi:hypothetical protein